MKKDIATLLDIASSISSLCASEDVTIIEIV